MRADGVITATTRFGGGVVEVVRAPVDAATVHAVVLSADEHERAARLRRPADRDRFRTAWVLTRRTLAERIGTEPGALEFVRSCRTCGQTGHGKPSLADSTTGWEFSLSHSHGYVMLATTDVGPVGVDIEQGGDHLRTVAAMVRSQHERADTAEELLWLWVQKEAALKATGDGLAVPMTSFSIDPLDWPANKTVAERLALADPGAPHGYRAAVAVLPDRPVGELRFG